MDYPYSNQAEILVFSILWHSVVFTCKHHTGMVYLRITRPVESFLVVN